MNPSVVGIVGLGSVGEPLLRAVRAAGHDVVGVESDPDVLARVDRRMKSAAADGLDGGDWLLTTDLAEVARADVVVEAVQEDLAVKTDTLRRAASLCAPHTVLVSTTAALPLVRIASASGRPDRTLALRFLRPPGAGGAVELVATAMSCTEAVGVLEGLTASLGLTPATVGARAGDDAVGLVYRFLNRAVAMIEDGYADRDAVDAAMRLGCGLPLGPLQLLDELGLDHVHAALTDRWQRTGDDTFRPAPLLGSLADAGALGRKSGQGFYTYDEADAAEGAVRTPSPTDAVREGGGAGTADILRVGVAGSGTMARGIAEVTAAAGLPTVLVARSREKADAAVEAIGASLTRSVRRGRVTPDRRAAALGLIESAEGLSALGDCDLVIEATAEELPVKQAVFARLGEVCRPGALLATTTSSLSVAACADASGRHQDVLGLHFFNPAPAMRLVELSRTSTTGEESVAAARAFCARLGKTTVECGDRAGFIVNYLLFPYLGDAVRLLDRHDSLIEETDTALEQGFGYPMGPFTLLDSIGLDVSLAIMRRLRAEFSAPDFAVPPMLEELVVGGALGRKSGQGFRCWP
ncbi:3-hydroxyacyl-CoA dehydrogenase family protein [Streptomyces sp. CB03238]|uniref:3-hydroxyacyl-CoA dehydrogenase family protein n=1 Tax=Streptomyces sp. CB03238 TaxID=1907777 RepID=UPI001F4E0459|nr:3-hydroxyacyl-CoA dehydrogenase family protein [Streptomyces sp. CB03238]